MHTRTGYERWTSGFHCLRVEEQVEALGARLGPFQ